MDRQLAEVVVIVADHATMAEIEEVDVRLIATVVFHTIPVVLTEGSAVGGDFVPTNVVTLRLPGSLIPLSSLDKDDLVLELSWSGPSTHSVLDVLIEFRLRDRGAHDRAPAIVRRRFFLASAGGPSHHGKLTLSARDLTDAGKRQPPS